MSKEIMQQALDALKAANVLIPANYRNKWIGTKAIAALEAELAKNQLDWDKKDVLVEKIQELAKRIEELDPTEPEQYLDHNIQQNMAYDMIDRYLNCSLGSEDYVQYSAALDALCTAAPRHEWVDLLDDDKFEIAEDDYLSPKVRAIIESTEAKLKEKNKGEQS